MASSTSSIRETRRRKIVDRGSDRLALITGRIQTLPTPDSSQPSISTDPNLQSHLHVHQTTVSSNGEDEMSDPMLQKHDFSVESNQNNENNRERGEENVDSFEMRTDGLIAPTQEISTETQPSFFPPEVQNSPVLPSSTRILSIFTPKNVISTITALEHIRFICSVTIAIVAVLSFLGFPLLSSMRSTIFSSPLYLVLLTNLTIFLVRLFEKQIKLKREDNRPVGNVPSVEGYGWAGQIGNYLEMGLAVQKVIDAVFMDCSVYAIIVICSLSLAQQLGW